MAMTLRLTDDENAALREQAEHEGRSMQDVARAAVREYVDRRGRTARLDQIAANVTARHGVLLKMLGEA